MTSAEHTTQELSSREVRLNMEVTQTTGESNKLHFFHVFFTTGYYLCIIPFRPVKNNKSKSYQLHTDSVQKLLCYCSWTLIMLGQLTVIRYRWQFGKSKRHPVIAYFKLVHAHVHACMYLCLFRTLYTKSTEIIEMLNQVSNSTLLKNTGITWWVVHCLHLLWIVLSFIAPIIGYELIDCRNWDFNQLLRSYSTIGRYTFFATNDQPKLGQLETLTPIHNDDVIYAFLQLIVSIPSSFQLFTIIPLLGCCSITIWSATNTFVDETLVSNNNCKKKSIEVISTEFRELKRLANSINSVWNQFCFWYLMDIVAWYSTELDAGLVSNDWFVKFVILNYLFSFTAVMLLSAESFRKVGYMCQELSGWSDEENGYNAEGLEREVSSAVIGLGSNGFYKFDYSFLAQVTVVIITYFIISVDKSIERTVVIIGE
ncbi:hypothetical protein Ocin01_11566 [Orchesella cincta]|uniref:Gustatory receptor n=1 Tax=Orchesella cincta TaxID=48709 RepID=A0A1D2MQS5_ORCCI|nr:hypothetical protein Ocin01_11566 [Orchesella cincta]